MKRLEIREEQSDWKTRKSFGLQLESAENLLGTMQIEIRGINRTKGSPWGMESKKFLVA
jgi:hypothetical protein